MVVAFTGHRPNKLGGFHTPNKTFNWVMWQLDDALTHLQPDRVISGMALGVDQWAAAFAVALGIPFTAAIPFAGQESVWGSNAQLIYKKLLDLADEKVIVCPGSYAPRKMQIRNEWMVDRCDVLLAVWDGSAGGTGNCVRYAEKKGKTIYRINPC